MEQAMLHRHGTRGRGRAVTFRVPINEKHGTRVAGQAVIFVYLSMKNKTISAVYLSMKTTQYICRVPLNEKTTVSAMYLSMKNKNLSMNENSHDKYFIKVHYY